jgi:hypothetical protein
MGQVIYVDFRFSRDIAKKQVISLQERIREKSERTRRHVQMTQTALDAIRLMREEVFRDINDMRSSD